MGVRNQIYMQNTVTLKITMIGKVLILFSFK